MSEEQNEDEIKAVAIIEELEKNFPEVLTAINSTINYNVLDSFDVEFLEQISEGLENNVFVLLDLDNFDVIVAETIPEIAESLPSLSSQPDPMVMLLFHKGRWLNWELNYAIKPIRYNLPDPTLKKESDEPH